MALPLAYLCCPHCGEALTRAGGAVRCAAGHSFDVARQGYVDLTGAGPRAAGDSAEMVAAREAFLAAGHFEPIAAAVAEEVSRVAAAVGVEEGRAGVDWRTAGVEEGRAGVDRRTAGVKEGRAGVDRRTAGVKAGRAGRVGRTAGIEAGDVAGSGRTAGTEGGDAAGSGRTADTEAGDAAGAGRTAGTEAGDAAGAGRTADTEAGDAAGAGRTADTEAGDAAGAGRTAGTEAGDAAGAGRTAGTEAGDAAGAGRTAGTEAGDAAGAGRTAGSDGDGDGRDARAGDVSAAGCVVEVGAGTGYYLSRARGQRPGIALDSSRYAARRAARAGLGAVVCDVWRELPVRDGVAVAVLCVFAPRNAPEMRRVLAPGGAIVVVTPTPRHLAELVEPLGLVRVDERKPERLAASLGEPERIREVEAEMRLSRDDVAALIGMGPSAHHVNAQRVARPAAATLSVHVAVYR